MVYIHSGGFTWGGSDDQESDGVRIYATPGWNETVLVTLNYRLSIFGFLASESLRARERRLHPQSSLATGAGNYGILDQQAAIKWVSRNIAAFGGDPKRVMLYGESAGATSVSVQTVLPSSFGYFQRATMDSGAFNLWTSKPWQDAVDVYNNVTATLGCTAWSDPLECMLTKDTGTLVSVSDSYYGNASCGHNGGCSRLPHPETIVNTQWGPVVDGDLLSASPPELLRQGKVAPNVDFLIGSNRNEGSSFLPTARYPNFISGASEFASWAAITFGHVVGPRVEALYVPEPMAATNTTALPGGVDYRYLYAAQEAVGDFILHCPTRRAARTLSATAMPQNSSTANTTRRVFAYTFDHAPRMSLNFGDPIPWVFGAYHGSEVGFVFDVAQELHGSEHDLAARMASYWTNFAASANPSPSKHVDEDQSVDTVNQEDQLEIAAGQSAFAAVSTNAASCLNGGSGGPCPVVLDVRTEKEWDEGHSECAHRIPVQDNHQLVEQVKSLVWGDLSRLVVTYCYSGTRAGQAEAVLRSAGFTNVLNGGGWVVPPSNSALLRSLCQCTSPCALDEVPRTMAAFVSPVPAYNGSFRTPRLGDLHRRFQDLPTACEVLVRVIGSSVNPADRGSPSGSVVMGADIAGRVVATNGVNCTRLARGDAVWADIGAYATPRVAAPPNKQQLQLESGASSKELGAYGQYAVALETQLGLKPINIGFMEAGVLPKVALTTIKAYTRYAEAPWTKQPKVLVLGGSGGTGTAGIMLAKHYGAGDIWTTSDNEEYCKELGASKVINYKTSNWWDVVAPSSFDVIYDCVGQTGTGDHAMTALRAGGHYVTLRGALASHPRPDVTQNAFTNSVDNLYNYELLDELKHIVETGGLRMRHIEEVFTLPHVANAFALSATGTVVGKLAISVSNWTSVRESTPLPVCPSQYFTTASCLDGDIRNSIEFADDATSRCCAACRVPGWLTEQPECSGWRLIPTTVGAYNGSGNCTLFQGSTTPTHAAASCRAATKHTPPNPPPPPTPVPCTSQQPSVEWPAYQAEPSMPEAMLALDTCNVAIRTGYRGRFCDFWDAQSDNVPPA